MSNKGLDLVLIRNAFYQKNYRSAVINFLLLTVAILVLAAFIYFMHISTIKARYFPTNSAGVYIEMPPLTENHLHLDNFNFNQDGSMVENPSINIKDLEGDRESALVIYWAKKALVDLYNYDYVNYRQALQDVRDYFTLNGHSEFLIALSFSRNLEAVKNNRQVLSAKIVGDPKIISGVFKGKQAWNIVLPISVTYENISDPPLVQRVEADIVIVRENTLRSPFYGLAIENINFKSI